MPDEGFDFRSELRIPVQYFRFQFLAVKEMRGAKLDTVAYQYAVHFKNLCPEIQIDKQHGHEKADDDRDQKRIHAAKITLLVAFAFFIVFQHERTQTLKGGVKGLAIIGLGEVFHEAHQVGVVSDHKGGDGHVQLAAAEGQIQATIDNFAVQPE